MTNVMGFTVKKDGSIYVCSDSQATGEKNKGTVQKLFPYGRNIFAGTGDYKYLLDIKKEISKLSKDLPADQIASWMVDMGKKYRHEGRTEDRLSIVLAGYKEGKPALYYIKVSGDEKSSPEFAEADSALTGSGSSKTGPAFDRDMETMNIYISDLAEGMNLCHSYSRKAGEDIFVDDKLQIGLVHPDGIRLLYHPEINLGSRDNENFLDYLRYTFNLPIKPSRELTQDESSSMDDLSVLLNDLYQGMLISCRKMNAADNSVNYGHTMSKVLSDKRGVFETHREKMLTERDEMKSYVSDLVEAWKSGSAKKISMALQGQQARRMKSYKEAEFMEQLIRKGVYSKQPYLPFP